MSDPLSDPRAADLLSADPGEVWMLASTFQRVASEAAATAAGLRGAQHDATWTGPAATAFRAKLGKLPGDLDKVERSYQDVASALTGYESELATIKPAFQRLATQLEGARSGLAGAQGTLSGAERSLTSATNAPHATAHSPAVQNAHSAVTAANQAVTRLQGEVSGLENQGMDLLNRFDTARNACHHQVQTACSIPPHESWLDSALHDVGNFLSGAGHFFASVGKGIYDGVTGLPGAIVAFAEHRTWKNFEKLASDVAITAGVVLLATGVGELALGADAAEGAAATALDAVNGAAGTVAKTASLAGAYGDGLQAEQDALEGKNSEALSQLAAGGLSAAVALTPELGDALPGSVTADTAEEAAKVVKGYAGTVGGGASPYATLYNMSDEDAATVVDQAVKSSSGTGLGQLYSIVGNLNEPEQMVKAAESNAKVLHIASLPAKVAVNFAADKLLFDPLTEADKARINHALGVCEGG